MLIGAFRHNQQSDSELGTRLLNGLARSRGVSGLSPSSLRQLLAAFPEQIQRDAAPILTGLGADDREIATRMKEVTARLVAGNAEHGKIVFFSNRAACSACHRVHGEGGTIGPDLSQIAGVRSREDLLQSILFPNSSIVNNYETYSVITIDGRIFEGVIQRATSRSIVLRNAQRQELVVARDDIGEIVRSKTSIMPQGLDQTIRIEELSDLLAFLESLRP